MEFDFISQSMYPSTETIWAEVESMSQMEAEVEDCYDALVQCEEYVQYATEAQVEAYLGEL